MFVIIDDYLFLPLLCYKKLYFLPLFCYSILYFLPLFYV